MVVLQSCSPEFIDDVTCWGVVYRLLLGLLRPAGSEHRKQTLQGPGVDSLQPCAPASEHSKGAKVEPSPGPPGLLSPSPAFPGDRRVKHGGHILMLAGKKEHELSQTLQVD